MIAALPNTLPANQELAGTQKTGIGAEFTSKEEEMKSVQKSLVCVTIGILKKFFSTQGLQQEKQ